ncbi:MAG: hypothetical protein N3A54_04580 [Patescibacteria group bacterium]|nr:hypothetical protein [Patescibacteria group bacterium]
MFKRILLFLLPVCLFLIGYPVRDVTKPVEPVISSSRCFPVGDLGMYLSCFRTHPRIGPVEVVKNIYELLAAAHPALPWIAGIAFIAQCVAVVMAVKKGL